MSDQDAERRRAQLRASYHKNVGPDPQRREAAAERARAWGRANKAKAHATHRDYVERNRDQVAAYKLEWQRQNRDAKRAAAKAERLAWERSHPDEMAAAKARKNAAAKASRRKAREKWRLANPGYHEAYAKKWVRDHPDLVRARGHARRVAGGQRIGRDVARRLFAARVCFYCGVGLHNDRTRRGVYHPCKSSIDHVVPITRGGTNKRENLVSACLSCNLTKHDKTGDEFLGRMDVDDLPEDW